ncbi:MAG: hypothetical protein KBF28_03750 [Gemmatimonadales bacterium]|nr:hypothetical protein [Gemmatimonadales bacterium]
MAILLHVVLFGCYAGTLAAALWLNYRHRDRPVMQAVLMPVASYALYAIVRRVVIVTGGDGAALIDEHFLVFFWLWFVGWLGWAVWMTERLRVGKRVLGPDGQQWGVVAGRVAGMRVATTKPMTTIIKAQVTAARRAREAEDAAEEAVTALTPRAEAGD